MNGPVLSDKRREAHSISPVAFASNYEWRPAADASQRTSSLWQPVVKVRLHSAGAASHPHPTVLKNARWGPRVRLRCSSFKYSRYCTPPCKTRTVGTPLCARRALPAGRIAPSVPRRIFTTGCWTARGNPELVEGPSTFWYFTHFMDQPHP
jgi:hypothetical protein